MASIESTADDSGYSEIKIFNCPYCDLPKLSVSGLYDHLTLQHLDVTFEVRCPICVCFDTNHSLIENMHLSKHIVTEHCTSYEQYSQAADELKFIASTLPPTYYDAAASRTTQPSPPGKSFNQRVKEDLDCPICWELLLDSNSRQLRCKHKFHSDCIRQWVDQNNSCPMCRKPVQ
ncbi:uncharacterized protein LOC129730872 isoform X2 [Wyeomyia smithii]|nr:uncharacterized protein LOC129730872 isoform X2 [Wyeomyia smithii]